MTDLPEASERSIYERFHLSPPDKRLIAPAMERLTDACARVLQEIGAGVGGELEREGLRDTPRRMAKALHELTWQNDFDMTTFDAEGFDEIVVQTDIPFFSLCEHHCLPFFGTAAVAYLPDRKIVGLSKLSRAVRYYAAGLQNQERITMQVADRLMRDLQPKGVAVVLRARHMCMEMRGVKTHDTLTTTSVVRGRFRENAAARAEVLSLILP